VAVFLPGESANGAISRKGVEKKRAKGKGVGQEEDIFKKECLGKEKTIALIGEWVCDRPWRRKPYRRPNLEWCWTCFLVLKKAGQGIQGNKS